VISLSADVLTIESSERSIVPEVPYKTALADAPRLKSLDKEDVYLQVPGSYRSSKDDLTALASDTPGSADEYERRGNTYLDAFKFDAAIADFTKALELEPKRATTLASRGITFVWKGDYQSAEKDLTASEALDPNNVVIFRARGLMAQRKGDPKAAVDGYTRALAIQPQDPFALGHRAEAYRSLKEDEKALSDSEQALRGLPDWFDLRMMRATMLLLAGKKDLASAEASKLIANNPTSSRTLVEAARIYARVGNKEEAMRAFDRALAIKPEAYIYLNRAQSRPFTDVSGRLADLDAALKLDANNVGALAEKAEQLAVAGNFKAALTHYDQLKKLVPDNSYFIVRRAIILYKTGATSEAETLLSAARKDAKTSSDFNNLCWAKATAGILLEEALKDCEEALKLNSGSGQVIDSLAFVKLRTGKLDEAIALYDQAIAKDTGSASYMGQAIAYARKGDSGHAEADREEALRLDPDAVTRFAEYGLKFDEPSGVATARKN
jgi:tetratricopeptide (TPR) repeat protein